MDFLKIIVGPLIAVKMDFLKIIAGPLIAVKMLLKLRWFLTEQSRCR